MNETPTMRIVEAGLLTIIQDRGRFGWEALGISRGGPVDRMAAAWANRLAQNGPDVALIEATLLGPTVTVSCDSWIATTGARVTVDGEPRPSWAGFFVRAGGAVSIKAIERARGYLAVHGGLAVPPILGSRATDLDSGFGGFEGRALRAGDEVPVALSDVPGIDHDVILRLPSIPQRQPSAVIRVVPGPHEADFSAEAAPAFYEHTYRASPHSSHMAVRLDGLPIPAPPRGHRISEPMPVGGIQITPAGQPIVLLAGRGTIGGYPLLATVITPDTWALGQVRPGQQVRFEPVTVQVAQELTRQAYAEIEANEPVLTRLEPA
jgi:biotin-dependent carboxylase-like uncharacterized protein